MTEEKIARINALAKKSKTTGLTEAEKAEAKAETDEAQKYSDYFNFSEPLSRCNGNRLLAMRRGEADGILNVRISVDGDYALERIQRRYVRGRPLRIFWIPPSARSCFPRTRRAGLPSIRRIWSAPMPCTTSISITPFVSAAHPGRSMRWPAVPSRATLTAKPSKNG